MKKTQADTWLEALKNNPKEIIEWCESEIREYQKLISLLKKKLK
jgi:hypothetical protein